MLDLQASGSYLEDLSTEEEGSEERFGKRPRGSNIGGRCSKITPKSSRESAEWLCWLDIVREACGGKSKPLVTSKTADERPFLEVDILEKEVIGLLDSGATKSLLDAKKWEHFARLGVKLERADGIKLCLADGSAAGILGKVTLPVKLEGKVAVIEFLVIPNLTHDLYLGVDFWRKMHVVPDLKRGTWEFGGAVEEGVGQPPALNSESSLDEGQRTRLSALTEEWKRLKPGKLGCTSKVEHFIDTGNQRPIKQRYYPVSPYVQGVMNQELDQMLTDGVVVPSNSPWSSPVVLVKKADGSHRFCVDYRRLNAVTKLRDARYLSTIDIKSAYWQVPLEENSREKTAFTVPGRGLFHFLRMPFGLHNAPATWQRLVDTILRDDLAPYVLIYLDDIIIVTSDFEKHLEILEEVFRRLAEANLLINWEKSYFCRSELKYLGYVVNQDGLRVDPDKVSAVMNYPRPETMRQIRRFVMVQEVRP